MSTAEKTTDTKKPTDTEKSADNETPAPPAPPAEKVKILAKLDSMKPLLAFKRQGKAKSTSTFYSDVLKIEGLDKKIGPTLSQLRKLGKIGLTERFCLPGDSTTQLSDDTTLESYISLTKENLDQLKGEETSETIVITIHVLSINILSRPEGGRVELPKFDKTLTAPEGSRAEVTQPSDAHRARTLAESDYKTEAGEGGQHPADLSKAQWEIVLKNNILTHGYVINGSKITLARRPAFRIKSRPVDQYIACDDDDDKPQGKTTIPEFRICDESSVTVVEITNEAQNSMAKNSFSSESLEASVSGGAFGVEVGANGGYAEKKSDGKASNTTTFEAKMEVSYNFPRVMVFLDSETLEPTDDCANMLKTIGTLEWGGRREAEIRKFYLRFGHMFPTIVRLGGRLTSSKLTKHFSAGSSAERAAQLKISAGASFSSPYVSGSVQYNNEKGDDSKTISNTMNRTESLTWNALGGDTVLCSNPPAWASTVKDFYNWRVIERSEPRRLEEILGAKDQFTLRRTGHMGGGST